ncbi:Endonuclease/exonuclease/phosphatase [Radiomyces spectabilis]|uniref:Endonuclease/exonuclease/phosphatase n=1 Tax=Radiomyces spectabilis TaxID=64574 RepID=UPI00221E45F9|nr:Endonuclease/exonuclease/phosphatase [Radiomyces spectabilis]KAI8366810.1 Endonuclease/exonuclease/phosphatase [Radiomyces spectabilis]
MQSDAQQLSVLSLNCWGLKFVSKQRQFRLRAIGDAVSQQEYDIVTLQELWVSQDYEYIKSRVADNLPYSKYFYSGALGSGLAIFSRYPIISSSYLRYSLAGRPLKIFHGDFYVGKGCGSACIEHPTIGILEVFTTHLHAGYGKIDEYEGHRVSESWELANLLRTSAAQGRQVIATGDFNSIPTSYNYALLKDHAFMTDSWLETHESSLEESMRQFQQNQIHGRDCIHHFGITCDSPENSWSKHFLKQQARDKNIGDRLDYIFYRRTPELSCISSNVAFTDFIANTHMCYSDHFAVHSIFSCQSNASAMGNNIAPQCSQLTRPTFSRISPIIVRDIINLLHRDHVATRRKANILLGWLVTCVFLILALYAVMIVVPIYYASDDRREMIATILAVFGGFLMILCAAAAPICLIVGFVCGHTEQRALQQFVVELRTFLSGLPNNDGLAAQRNVNPHSSRDLITVDSPQFNLRHPSTEESEPLLMNV